MWFCIIFVCLFCMCLYIIAMVFRLGFDGLCSIMHATVEYFIYCDRRFYRTGANKKMGRGLASTGVRTSIPGHFQRHIGKKELADFSYYILRSNYFLANIAKKKNLPNLVRDISLSLGFQIYGK